MSATARLVVMMDPKQKQELEKRAKAANVSLAEVVRRRLSGKSEPEEAAFFSALAELRPVAQRALRAVRSNLKEIHRIRDSLPAVLAKARADATSEFTPQQLTQIATSLQRTPAGSSRRGMP
jgi:hypothetical protein